MLVYQRVDASGMAVRVCAEKAVSAEEGQNLQVRMESAGRKSCILARTSVEEKTSGIAIATTRSQPIGTSRSQPKTIVVGTTRCEPKARTWNKIKPML